MCDHDHTTCDQHACAYHACDPVVQRALHTYTRIACVHPTAQRVRPQYSTSLLPEIQSTRSIAGRGTCVICVTIYIYIYQCAYNICYVCHVCDSNVSRFRLMALYLHVAAPKPTHWLCVLWCDVRETNDVCELTDRLVNYTNNNDNNVNNANGCDNK